MRTTYKKLYEKYPGKRIYLILPQKRYDENTTYSTGASYKHYRDAQIEVANEYSIPIIDLYDLMPGKKGTAAYNTYMLNDTHWNALGNERVAELVARHLIGGGNTVSRKELPPIPQANGNYVLKLVITNGIPSFSWVAE